MQIQLRRHYGLGIIQAGGIMTCGGESFGSEQRQLRWDLLKIMSGQDGRFSDEERTKAEEYYQELHRKGWVREEIRKYVDEKLYKHR